MNAAVLTMRMERQGLLQPVLSAEYDALYRDLQPGQNVYWHGFGDPPSLSFRTAFDDIAYNRERQRTRSLLKGRFAGGNIGWITKEDLPLFAALYMKPLTSCTAAQNTILDLLTREGPMNIQQIKEETGMLVKDITPVLHRLQEAFLVYEDQYDGEWDRGWYLFEELFSDVNLTALSRQDALCIVLQRFAYRFVWFDATMVKSYYRLPQKDIAAAIRTLCDTGVLQPEDGGYMLRQDVKTLPTRQDMPHLVRILHRNDPLYKAFETELKTRFAPLYRDLPYDHEPLQYLLLDGMFRGVVVGHFRYGPYDMTDVICDLSAEELQKNRELILTAVAAVNNGHMPQRWMGMPL